VSTYEEIRGQIKTGDIVLVKGDGVIGKIIRALTAESYSHVALFLWLDGGLWIAEMREGVGFNMQPASQWFDNSKDSCMVGFAPEPVRVVPDLIIDFVMKSRADKLRYSYFTLFTVWLSQLIGRVLPAGNVCSTWVEKAWRLGGLSIIGTPDPGDFAQHCTDLKPIRKGG